MLFVRIAGVLTIIQCIAFIISCILAMYSVAVTLLGTTLLSALFVAFGLRQPTFKQTESPDARI